MRKHVLGVVVTADTLKGAPYGRQGAKKTQEAGVGRVALFRPVPRVRVEAEEQFDIL